MRRAMASFDSYEGYLFMPAAVLRENVLASSDKSTQTKNFSKN